MLRTFVRPSRDLRNNYAELAKLVKGHDQVIITNNGKGEAVLIGMDDYALYENFLHRRYVAEALAKSQLQANDTTTEWLNHDEVWNTLEAHNEL